jgi:hypothetical protein
MQRVAPISIPVLALILMASPALSETPKIVGLSGGIIIAEERSVYLDDPIDAWADRDGSFVLEAQLYWRVTEPFWMGPYVALETLSTPGQDGTRFGGGFTAAGRYPASGTGIQVGSTVGLSSVSLGDLDGQFGLDYSAFIGPIFQLSDRVDAAIHLVGFYGWYTGGDVPEAVQDSNPRVRFQVYLKR